MKNRQWRGLAIIAAVYTASDPTSSIMQINIEFPSVWDIKVSHPGKVETGHKWITWDVKWEHYIESMVGVSGINLNDVMRCDIPVGWAAMDEHNHLKYQAIQIGTAWDTDEMFFYTNIKAYWLDVEDWSCIKAFDAKNDGRQATENSHANYEGSGEVNNYVAWATANIYNAHFTSKHTLNCTTRCFYSLE